MESLDELNRICQKPRYKEVGNWMVRNILRDAALPVTWVLLHTPITANQVTLVSFFVGLIGIIFFGLISPVSFLWGAILLQVWYLLDHVDGQVARYRKTASLSGRFFDYVMHHIIHMIILFSLGIYSYRMSGSGLYVLWGFAASVSIMTFNLISDVKCKTFFEWMVAYQKPFKATMPPEKSRVFEGKNPLFRMLFSVLHKLCEVHVMMNVLTGAALLQLTMKEWVDLRFVLFFVYGIVAPLIAVAKISYIITQRRIDEELSAYVERFEG